jgi:hypothetical protein
MVGDMLLVLWREMVFVCEVAEGKTSKDANPSK